MTIHFNFGNHLDKALRSRFICGLNTETIQKRLLTEADLSFAGATDIAHGMESAAENAQKLQGVLESKDVYCLTPAEGEAKPCYRCGQQNHKPAQCPYKSDTCCYCNKQGYLKQMCLKRPQSQQSTQQVPSRKNVSTRRPPGQSVRAITTDAQKLGLIALYTINGISVKPFTVHVKLND